MDINTALAHMVVATLRNVDKVNLEKRMPLKLTKFTLVSEAELVALQTLLNCDTMDANKPIFDVYMYISKIAQLFPVSMCSGWLTYSDVYIITGNFWYGFTLFMSSIFWPLKNDLDLQRIKLASERASRSLALLPP